MKEKILANLPAFRNLFQELINRCEFLKKFIADRNMNMDRKFDMAGNDRRATHNPWPWVLKPADGTSSNDTKSRFIGIIDSIVRGCSAFTLSCEQVIREIGDDPKYLETQKNSIKDYKTQYGVNPFMPLSSTLTIFRNTTAENYMDFFPIHSLGKDQFKFAYGTRSLLAQPKTMPNLDHVPGMGDIITMFNSASDSRTQVDKRRADDFLKSFVSAMRYMFELKHIKGVLTTYTHADASSMNGMIFAGAKNPYIEGSFVRGDLILTDDNANNITKLTNRADISLVASNTKIKAQSTPAYAISKTFADTIKLTESSSRDDQMKLIIEHISSKTKKPANLELQNIIDLGIVPINVHGLMRGIPFANLYNYGYTFDRFIVNLYYNLDHGAAKRRIKELCDYEIGGDLSERGQLEQITSAKDMLVAMLLNPYMSVTSDDYEYYEKYVKGMLLGGANNGELGRPKLLSDQLYGKVLFGELYSSQNDYSELGPIQDTVRSTKLSDNQIITIMAEMLVDCMRKIETTNGRWNRRIFTERANATVEGARRFCTIAAELVVRNPKAGAAGLAKKLASLAASAGITPGVFFVGDTDLDAMNNGAGWITIAAVLLYGPLQHFASNPSAKERDDVSQALYAIFHVLRLIGGDGAKDLYGWAPNTIIVNTLRTILKAAANDPGAPDWFSTIVEPTIERLKVPPAMDYAINNNVNDMLDENYYKGILTKALSGKRDKTRSFGSEPTTRRRTLHWIKKDTGDGEMDSTNIDSAEIPEALVPILGILGPLRFDTVLIRNLIFIVNLVRSVRLKMSRDLAYSRDIVIKSQPVARTRLTEFFGNETEHGKKDRHYDKSHETNKLYDY
jgi:hypothetical protein